MQEKRTLIVIDMQNDFIYGPLGTDEATGIVPGVQKKVDEYRKRGDIIIYTKDVHDTDRYLSTHEGRYLPVKHCDFKSPGRKIVEGVSLDKYPNAHTKLKDTFGYLGWMIAPIKGPIEIVGVCTDICVVSNALILRAMYPETDITVDASCCAGTTPEMHKAALAVMKSCHIDITNY